MNILIDIGHPAHVHLFKHFIKEMENKGFEVTIASKEVESIITLLELYEFKYELIGKKRDSLVEKYIDQLKYITNLLRICKKKNIDFSLGISMILPIISRLRKMIVFGFDDDDMNATPKFAKYVNKSNVILTPDVLKHENRGEHHITFAGYHELAYLHPKRFTPEPEVLDEAGLKEGEKYFILRFNSFKAHHDIGMQGLSIEDKRNIVSLLSEYGKVFITTEQNIDKEFEPYQIKIPAHKIHSFLYYSTMFLGDSQTMTSEAAVLGVPSIRSNSFVGKISYLEEQEHKYNLTYGFKPEETEKMFLKVRELLVMPNLKEEWQKRRRKMLSDKIDVTAFMVWFVENYPDSHRIMKENPNYHYSFR